MLRKARGSAVAAYDAIASAPTVGIELCPEAFEQFDRSNRSSRCDAHPELSTCNSAAFTAIRKFSALAKEVRATKEGRHQDRVAIHHEIAAVTIHHGVEEILADLRAATIPTTRNFDIRQVRELPQLKNELSRSLMPDGRPIRMQSMAVDESTRPAVPAEIRRRHALGGCAGGLCPRRGRSARGGWSGGVWLGSRRSSERKRRSNVLPTW